MVDAEPNARRGLERSASLATGGAWAGIAAALVVATWPGPLHARMAAGTGALLVAGGLWLACLARALRGSGPSAAWVLAGAVLLRLVALGGDGRLSDDTYRYAFEGGLVLAGVSPYAEAPASAARAPFRERWPGVAAGVNHPEVSAAYPPGMQTLAALTVALAGGPEPPARSRLAFRLAHALFDLAVLWPLALLARRRGRPVAAAWIAWGWCPVVLLSFAGTGHFDAAAIALLVGALAALDRERPTGRTEGLGRALLAAAVLVKYLPIVALCARAPRRTAVGRWLTVGALVALGSATPLLLDGGARGLGAGLGEYGLRWESTSVGYRLVEPLFEPGGPLGAGGALPLGGEFDGGLRDPRRLGRLAVGVLFAAVALAAVRRGLGPTRASAALLLAFCLLTPTLHPWYLTFVAVFLGVVPRTGAALLVAAAPLLYWPLEAWHRRGEWAEPPWLWPAVLLPCMLFVLAESHLPPRWRPIR